MEELKPCPFCGSKAKFGANKSCCGKTVRIDCTNPQCGANINAFSSKAEAIKVWNRRAATEDNPLTLEQLREMGGEQVWIPETEAYFSGYGIVNVKEEKVYQSNEDGDYYPFDEYGAWLAYARKPEESNPLMNELREKLNQLEAEVTAESGDAAETYTNGYIWGHRNGQIELLRRILKTDEGGTIKLEGSEKP